MQTNVCQIYAELSFLSVVPYECMSMSCVYIGESRVSVKVMKSKKKKKTRCNKKDRRKEGRKES